MHLPKFGEREAFKVADVGFYPTIKHYPIHPNQGAGLEKVSQSSYFSGVPGTLPCVPEAPHMRPQTGPYAAATPILYKASTPWKG